MNTGNTNQTFKRMAACISVHFKGGIDAAIHSALHYAADHGGEHEEIAVDDVVELLTIIRNLTAVAVREAAKEDTKNKVMESANKKTLDYSRAFHFKADLAVAMSHLPSVFHPIARAAAEKVFSLYENAIETGVKGAFERIHSSSAPQSAAQIFAKVASNCSKVNFNVYLESQEILRSIATFSAKKNVVKSEKSKFVDLTDIANDDQENAKTNLVKSEKSMFVDLTDNANDDQENVSPFEKEASLSPIASSSNPMLNRVISDASIPILPIPPINKKGKKMKFDEILAKGLTLIKTHPGLIFHGTKSLFKCYTDNEIISLIKLGFTDHGKRQIYSTINNAAVDDSFDDEWIVSTQKICTLVFHPKGAKKRSSREAKYVFISTGKTINTELNNYKRSLNAEGAYRYLGPPYGFGSTPENDATIIPIWTVNERVEGSDLLELTTERNLTFKSTAVILANFIALTKCLSIALCWTYQCDRNVNIRIRNSFPLSVPAIGLNPTLPLHMPYNIIYQKRTRNNQQHELVEEPEDDSRHATSSRLFDDEAEEVNDLESEEEVDELESDQEDEEEDKEEDEVHPMRRLRRNTRKRKYTRSKSNKSN